VAHNYFSPNKKWCCPEDVCIIYLRIGFEVYEVCHNSKTFTFILKLYPQIQGMYFTYLSLIVEIENKFAVVSTEPLHHRELNPAEPTVNYTLLIVAFDYFS